MWVYIVELLIRIVRWFIISCVIKPLVERVIVRPLYEVLVEAGVGGVSEDMMEVDAELGEVPVGGVTEDAVEEDAEEDERAIADVDLQLAQTEQETD